MHAMPGSPFSQEEQKKLTAEQLAKLEAKYGLDQPAWKQYITYWKGLLKFDFGNSFKKPDTEVNEIVFAHFPTSAQVGGIAVLVALLSGIPLGIAAGAQPRAVHGLVLHGVRDGWHLRARVRDLGLAHVPFLRRVPAIAQLRAQ